MITDLISSSILLSSSHANPPTSSTSNKGPVLFSGFLYRLSNKLLYKSWIKRYVELQDNVITYYNTKKSSALGQIVLSNRIIFEDSSLRHFCFCLTDTSKSEVNYFAADSIADKEAWTEKIRIAIIQAKFNSHRRARSQLHSTVASVNHQIEARKEYQNRPQLYVKIIKARNLIDKDVSNTSDPYVNVYIGSSTVRTTVQKKTLNPEWGMVFNFDMYRSYRYAKIEVWDKDYASSDDFMGMALIPLLPLRDGTSFRAWYPLNKRTSKSHVRGEIEIELSCSGDPDRNHYSWYFFRCVRDIPELRMDLLNPTAKDGDHDDADALTLEDKIGNIAEYEGFPYSYPPIQTEILEDFSIRVQLSCISYGSKVSVRGVLLLTNYRLIFITLSRILSSGQNTCDSSTITNCLASGSIDLTTQIPLGCIVSAQLTTETESGNNNTVYEVIRIKTTDHRSISFLLCEDIEYQIPPWSPTGTTEAFSMVNKRTSFISSVATREHRSDTALSRNSASSYPSNIKPFQDVNSNSDFHTEEESDELVIEEEQVIVDQVDPRPTRPTSVETSRRPNSASVPALVQAIEKTWLNLISEASYLVDNADSDEGSPFTRIYNRLNIMIINRGNEQLKWTVVHSELFASVRPSLPTRSPRSTLQPTTSSKGDLQQQLLSSSISNKLLQPTTLTSSSSVSSPVMLNVDNDEEGDIVDDGPADLPMGWSKEDDINKENPVSEEEIIETNASLSCFKEKLKHLPLASIHRLQSAFDDGWHVYDPFIEFQRIGIPDWLWRITTINSNYELCSSYPSVLAVPSSIDDDVLVSTASFRSRGRIPVLVWRNVMNNCTISRCSQPLVGISQSRNIQDELLVSAINQSGGAYARERYMSHDTRVYPISSSGKPFLIVDARPMLNATANQAAGKGTESEKNYENSQVSFMDIANIHAIRKSLELLEDACTDEAHWLRNLDASGWFSFLIKILRASVKIVYTVAYEERSVLVHCSDGWDRTSQLTSISSLMLDPYYRTLRGFIVLIEKEWLSFGHKFGDRLGWTAKAGLKDEECSAIFQQFLECVFQCISQSPNVFEFNEDLLLLLREHTHSGWFGNFLFNNERERKESKIELTAVSIWTVVLQHPERYTNKSFQATSGVIIPVTTKHRMVVWSRWYFRWQERIWIAGWLQASIAASSSNSSSSNAAGYGNNQDDGIGMQLQIVDGEQTLMPGQGNNQMVWADDKSAKSCRRCSRQFGLIRRKHHCRACGQIFCEPCCSEMRMVTHISNWKTSRVCIDCAHKIDLGDQSATTLSNSSSVSNSTSTKNNPINSNIDDGMNDSFSLDTVYSALDSIRQQQGQQSKDENSKHDNLSKSPDNKQSHRSSVFTVENIPGLPERIKSNKMVTINTTNQTNGQPMTRHVAADNMKQPTNRNRRSASLRSDKFDVDGIGKMRRELDGNWYVVRPRSMSFSAFDALASQQYATSLSMSSTAAVVDDDVDDDDVNEKSISLSQDLQQHDVRMNSIRSISVDQQKRPPSREIRKNFSPMTSVAQYARISQRDLQENQLHGGRALTPPPQPTQTATQMNTKPVEKCSNRFSSEWANWDTF